MDVRPFRKLLCANRSEIAIRVFRACAELGIRTVAVFSEEDATNQHRYKADESYLVGQGQPPVKAYLDQQELLEIARRSRVDAIHPGYGFLSENAEFADAVRDAGIAFVGPAADVIRAIGDKVSARQQAERAGVQVVPGLELPADEVAAAALAEQFFESYGTTIVKAAHGGGGRGMRVVEHKRDLLAYLGQARSEAGAAFGSAIVFLEKYMPHVRHIEVQVLGDRAGSVVHLFERDCSVQRRHQKLVEIAPAPRLASTIRQHLLDDSLKLARAIGYHNAGTFEFLVAGDEHYFIEVNPRLQVEHTVTEQITGIDIVQAQIRVEEGHSLDSPEIGIASQSAVQAHGYAIQCRITAEDPANDFLPDTGTILAYRAPGGFGLRLDGGDGLSGTKVAGYYDSLLVKCITYGSTLAQAAQKGLRALREFRIRGVKTNLPFLQNVLAHDTFLRGETWTRFIDESPELFELARSRDRATRLLSYLANLVVNGHPTIEKEQRPSPMRFSDAPLPVVPAAAPPSGTATILAEGGPGKVIQWIKQHQRPLLTDTTMRDAHQSLLATRVRTRDMTGVAHAAAHLGHELFSLKCNDA